MTDRPQPPSPWLPSDGGPVGRGEPAPYDPTRYAAPPAPGVDGPWGPLADWGVRVGASLIDSLVGAVAVIPYAVGVVLIVAGAGSGYDSTTLEYEQGNASRGLVAVGIVLIALGFLLAVGITLWNRTFRQGRTGQSIGKKVLGLKLVEEHSGQPVGAGMAFVRELCHTLDGIAYLGYLWPLWDDKRQTFADKIVGTVVVRVPRS